MNMRLSKLPNKKVLGKPSKKTKKNRKISDMRQITSYPLPPQPNKDKIDSDTKLEL